MNRLKQYKVLKQHFIDPTYELVRFMVYRGQEDLISLFVGMQYEYVHILYSWYCS